MKVVILCGGKGTRLREETEFRPKPLVEIGGKPILWHIMKIYAHFGFTEFVLCLGYRGYMIKEYFLNYTAQVNDFTIDLGDSGSSLQYHNDHEERNFKVSLVETGIETLTGGRLKRVEPYIEGKTFMLTYGDGLGDIDIHRLVEFHASHGKVATVTAVRPFSRFGGLELGDGGLVRRFREKPQIEEWISGGFFVFDRRVFEYLNLDGTLEQAPLARLAEDHQLMAYTHTGFWYAMDTYREYQYLNELWESRKVPWKVWETKAVTASVGT
ncbi:MAG: glucose-1-phosphate cytidylyltransferase [Acidobacteria bacterium]|nr:glucose-1-phosphate cytidylyltransferase [Acidobacteriota bacterium]